MKSIKPGRGPSMMGGVASVFAVVFGIIWMCGAASMGAPGFFLLFGVAFIGVDIVDSDEEPDPLNVRFGSRSDPEPEVQTGEPGRFAYCPYCGARLGEGFAFCGKCGKALPKQDS